MAKKKIQYQDKTRFDVSGDQITGKFTYADANQIKDVVNTNADLLHDHNNKLFLDKINQDLSDLASPNFKNLGVEGNVNANVVSANTEVNTANVNATNRVNTKLLNADNAVVNFHINSDTLTAETQIDTNILNAILQVNTDTVNADSAVNTDILNADSQVNTVEVRTNIARVGEQSSEAFVSGFAGLGYRLAKDSNGNYMLELDRLSVRKDFTVYELIVSQIRATNGSLWVSDATKIESVTKDGANYKCTIDTDGDTIWIPFQVDDIVRCQKFNGKNMKYYTAKVISINTTDKHFTLQVIEGANFPQAKDDIVRIGNATNTNRQGAVYLTASDNGAPFIDVIDGVTSASLAGKTKVRLGKLDGIVDPSLGQLSGYGLYANSAYIKGKFIVENGSNVYTKTENDGKISTAKNEAVASAKTYTDSQSTKAYNDAKTYADTEIAELRQSVNDLETEIEGAFADGIIQEAEAISIEKYINVLAREKADIDNQFTIVYGNVNLTGATKTNLNTAKTNLNTSYTSLVSAINTAIQDGKTTPTEKTAVDNAFADYKNKIGVYSTRVNEALEAIRNKGINDLNASMKAYSDAQDSAKETIIKAYADGKVDAEEARAIADAEAKLNQAKADATQKANDAITTSTNNAKAYTDAQINELGDVLSDLESTINTTFQDGIIEKAEAIAIEKYINEINVEKLQLDNQYSIVYANTNLVGTAKTNLASAKTAYNSNHTTLINSINNAIADGKTTVAEKNAVNTHFGNYRTALGTLSTRIQEAIESIRSKASSDLDTTLKAYALAQDNLKETIIKAYADGIVTEEEQRAIADAEAKLAQAKADATAKANQAKQDAINASAIDAQNKANQAQANAIASSNQFALDAVKAINIGGRNLLRDSRHKNFKLYGSASYGNIQLSDDYPTDLIRINKTSTAVTALGFQNNITDVFSITQGEELTISFDVRSENIPSLNYIYIMRNDGSNQSFGTITIPSGENFTRVSRTFTAPFTSSLAYLMLAYNGANTGWFEVKSIKIERGNKATDWSPNPDEVEDNLEIFRTQTTSKFEVLDTAIQSKVSQSDYNALNQRVGTAESTIIQHANQIQSKVSQTAFDTLNNGVNSLTGRVSSAESTITQQAGLIATKVTQSQVDVSVNTALGNINIGGRNYITNSANEWSTPGMSSYSAYGIYRNNLNDLFEKLLGKPLMISFEAKVDLINGATSGGVRVYSSNGNAKYTYSSLIPSVTKDWIRYEAPINLVNTSNTGAGKIEFYGEGANANLVKIYVRNLKLEIGTKATDWTPAPEDIDGELSGLKNRVTSAETSITQNADAIALRATKTEVTTAQNSAIATSKSYTDNSISVTNNAIALKADKTVTDALNSRLNSAELKITPTAIISTVKGATETIVNEAVNNLQVGATNIFYDSYLKSPQMWGTTLGTMASTSLSVGNSVKFNKTSATDGAFGYQRNSGTQTFSVVNGEEYTLSFDIRGNIGYLNYVFLMRNEAGQANQQLHSELNRLELTGINSTTYIRASTTFKSTFTNDVASILLALSVGVTFWFEIKNIKVEKGNKATDWSPNPSEVESRMVSAESSIIQQAGLIASKVSQTEVNSTVNNAVNGMTLSNRNILLKSNVPYKKLTTDNIYQIGNYQVAPSYKLLPPNKVYTLVVKGSNSGAGSLGVWVDGSQGIKQDLISNETDVIKTIVFTRDSRPNIGGGIYFYHYPQGSAGESSVEWACLYEGNITKPNLEWLPAPEDTDNANVVVGGRNLIYGGFENGSWNQASVGQGTDTSMGRAKNVFDISTGSEYTFSMKEGTVMTPNRLWITFRNADDTYHSVIIRESIPFTFTAPAPKCTITYNTGYYSAYNGGSIFKSREPKLELGNKVTGWTQAPEDIDSEFSSLNTTVTSHNTLITQNTTAINLRATKSEVTTQVTNAKNEAISEVTEVKNTRDTNETPAWYFANYKSRTVREFKFMNVIGLTGVAGTFCQLSTNVPWTDATGGAVVQTATVDNRSFTRYGTTTSWTSWTESESTVGSQAKATSAQTNAVSTSKTYTDSQITVVNNAISLKSDKTVTDGLTARITSAETKITPDAIKSTVRAETQQIASDAVTSIQVGGRNLLLNSNAGGSYFNGYSGATVTKTNNTVSVSEWGATDANRVVSSGGNNSVRVLVAIGVPKTGETVTLSGWFKNNGTTPFVIASNQGARSIRFEAGEQRRVVFEGIEGNGVGSVQFQVNPTVVSNNVDFTWWRMKYEYGNKVTDWSPSPDDVENKVTALTTRITNAETSITQTNNAIALKADKTVTDGLTNRISTAEAKITPEQINLTVKDQTQQIANQATAQTFANGKMLYTDPAFVVGENGMVQYPSSVGTVMSRVNNQTDSPTKNNIAYKFLHTAMADSNRCSLVRWANQSRANAIFVTRIIAKLPVGWRIQDAHNTYGDSANRSVTWLTPTLGTGMYEEYVLKLVCGNTGTFSTINHFDLRKVDASTPTPTTANPIESYIAWATVYDMSEVYNKPDEEEIKAGISITSNSVNVFGKSLSLAGKVTFTSLDSGTQSTINTANNNASSALSTAGTANSNANTALSTANTANSNATNAKSKTDAWTYTGKTTINGGQIEANSITADKINTDNLTARQIKTSDLTSRLSINETNDNTIKIRHTNGQVAISMGLVGGVPKIVFYDSSGNKVWEGGTAGIVYVNDVPESWTTGNLFFMDSISSATETLTTTKINTFKNKIKLNSSGSVTNRQMNSGTIYYLYSEGINATSGTNKQYVGYHTNQVKSVSNFIPNGWYVFGNSTLFSDGPGSGTYSATVFKVFNGLVQDDYDVISGIS